MDKERKRGIGNRITEVRHAHNVTQETLSEVLDVSPKHISHVENGAACFSLDKLILLCEFFDCSLDYIIFGTSKNDPSQKLPEGIVRILHTGTEMDIKRLNRYLEMYLDLTSGNHD